MSKKRLSVLFAASVLAAAPAAFVLGDGSIGVYLDAAGTQCQGPIAGVTIGSVWMNLAGATTGGITGAEFRIDNSDASSIDVTFQPDPSVTIAIGNAFLGGINVSFYPCQTGTAGRVKLGSLVIAPMSSTPDVMLTVRPKFEPSNVNYPCAAITQCDGPVFTEVCVGAPFSDLWRAVMNPTGAIAGDCQPVGVSATSWSAVKNLYKN